MPFLLAVHGAVHRRRPSSSPTSAGLLGLLFFIVANFAYQAALIYYDATLKLVSLPETRGRLSGIGTAIGYGGTVFVACSSSCSMSRSVDRFRLAALLYLVFAIPIFLSLRERRAANAVPLPGGGRARVASGNCGCPSPTPARSRGSAGSSWAGSSTATRSTRSSWS